MVSATSAAADTLQIELIDPARLLFDAKNPRLRGDDAEPLSQPEIAAVLWRDFAVDEVAASIAANGFLHYEQIFATEESGGLVVVEGNRRLAAVKALTGELCPPGIIPPRITAKHAKTLEQLPVVVRSREALWEFVGFKHVNGAQNWRSASKADYIANVHNDYGIPLAEIAKRIGDKHATAQRLYRALMVIQQAEAADLWTRADRWKEHFSFSHLYTGLDYAGVQDFVGLKESEAESRTPIPKTKTKELGELCVWLFGSKSRQRAPLVVSQNPDLRILSEVLQSKDGVAALRQGLPLRVGMDISKGDEALLHESLVSAKRSLQAARGYALTGFNGETSILDLSDDVLELAGALNEDLRDAAPSKTKRRRRA